MTEGNKNTKQTTEGSKITRHRPLKWLYISIGTLAVFLGFLGIFVPLLPTTSFLLIAAWAYARSSQRFYDWLLNNRMFGRYIKAYLQGRGMPVVSKVSTLILLWVTMLTTTIFFVDNIYVIIILLAIAVGVTIHILRLPTYKKGDQIKDEQAYKEKLSSS